MQNKNNLTMYILLGVAGLAILGGIIALISWGTGAKATPTVSIDAIYTSAAETVVVQQATLKAANPPTTTPFPTFPIATPTGAGSLPNPTLPPLASPTTGVAAGCNSSVYVSDVTIPDDTVMTPGQKFTKTWLIQNNGTCTWDTSYKLASVSGDVMSGVTTALTLSVPPGQQLKVSVDLVAPDQAGSYKGYWQLVNGSGANFGNQIYVAIKVALATDTPTPAPTDTPEPTATP